MARELVIDEVFPEGEWYIGEAGYGVIDFEVNTLLGGGENSVYDGTMQAIREEGWLPLRIQVYREPQYSGGMYTAVWWGIPADLVAAESTGSLDAITAAIVTAICLNMKTIIYGLLVLIGLVVIRSIIKISQPVLYNLTGGPLSALWPVIIGVGVIAVAYWVLVQPKRETGIRSRFKRTKSTPAAKPDSYWGHAW